MPTPYGWWAGDNDERLSVGPEPTRDAAIAEAVGQCAYAELDPEPPEHPDWRILIHVCEATQHTADDLKIDADDVLERLYTCYEDWVDPDNDDALFTVTAEDVADLSTRLIQVLHDWAKDKKLNAFMFADSRNHETVVLPHPDNGKPES